MYTVISTPNLMFVSFVNSINFYETNKFTKTQPQKLNQTKKFL